MAPQAGAPLPGFAGTPPSAPPGFALVEALASLVIVGMIALMLTAGATTGRRVWEHIDTRQSAADTLESVQSVLRSRIEQIYPATLFDRYPPDVDFQGAADGMTFLASPPEAERPAPLRRYSLRLDGTGDLVLASDAAPAARQVLFTGAHRLDIAYFGPSATDSSRAWRPSWQGEAGLPERIRIRLILAPGDPRPWPDLIVQPRATVDSACLLNIVTHGCRGRS